MADALSRQLIAHMDHIDPQSPFAPLRLLRDFHGFFHAWVAENAGEAAAAWTTRGARTAWHARMVADAGTAMELTPVSERLRVDHALATSVDGHAVPVIFIESENHPGLAHEEVEKLAQLTAPLRVLLTVAEWDETPGVWPGGGSRRQFVAQWRRIAAAHAAVAPQSGYLVALVGERHGARLRYYTEYIWSPDGQLPDRPVGHFERMLPTAGEGDASPGGSSS